MLQFNTLVFSLLAIFFSGNRNDPDYFLSPQFVNLKGEKTVTVIRNATNDTVRLKGSFFNDLPYSENWFTLSIPPGQQDTIKLTFTYPDFIHLESPHYFRLFNAPGRTLYCEIAALNSHAARIKFQGSLADVNDYYLAYHNRFGSRMENNRSYFELSDQIDDFNKFPAAVDSINSASIDFLRSYKGLLPSWFRTHEEWRLKYLAGFLKHNVLLTKEFYGGKPIPVNETYYAFEKDLPLENSSMIFNNQYLWYIRSVTGRATRVVFERKKINNNLQKFDLSVTDSLFKGMVVGDLMKMDRLGMIYHSGFRSKYDSLIEKVVFVANQKKQILDSLVRTRYGLPMRGKSVPQLKMTDLNGALRSFDEFKGKHVIIYFWATWCGPCLQEFPKENELFLRFKERGLVVVNVCVDSNETQWRSLSKSRDLKTINLFTDKNQFPKIADKFGIAGLPKSVLLDKDLNVVDNNFKRASELTAAEIERILRM